MSSDDAKPKGIIVHGPALPSGGNAAIRVSENGIAIGEISNVQEGKSIPKDAELVELEPHPVFPISTIKESTELSSAMKSHSGPALVNSEQYRNRWTEIFGRKSPAQA